MDANVALELAERLVLAQTGKYLSDLERAIFIGSWQGQTYATIHPTNPEYVEKDVSYKLWQKLTIVFGEKVTKKKLQGVLERALKRADLTAEIVARLNQNQVDIADLANLEFPAVPLPDDSVSPVTPAERSPQWVLISYRPQEPDASLAHQFYAAIVAAGHQAQFTDSAPDLPLCSDALNWPPPINPGLQPCDYFLLLLSPEAAMSEMVIEELQQVTEQGLRSSDRLPVLLPIWLNCPSNRSVNHDLQLYLQNTTPLSWHTPDDTPDLIQTVLDCINGSLAWGEQLIQRCQAYRSTSASVALPLPAIPTPSPVADPEIPQGQVRWDSGFYIERQPYEAQCYREILQPGTLIRIKAPRQMGKTSLMSRILSQAREQGYRTVPLTFQHADAGMFASLDQFLQWFCNKITRKLRLPHQIEQYWTDTYGSKDNCTAYFEDYLLSEIDSPLVLGLDEVDRIFQHPKIADDFFGLLRAWYEEAGYGDSESGVWQKLRLIVVHSTEVYIPLDVNQSPFNVGLPVELAEFNLAQVLDLVQRHHLNLHMSEVEQLMQIVGGHPYLIRLALYHLACQHLTLAQLTDQAPTEAGIYGDHLRRHLWNLQQHPELAIAWSEVITHPGPIELESVLAFKLHSLGLVNLQGNQVSPRFELYRRYFSERLLNLGNA